MIKFLLMKKKQKKIIPGISPVQQLVASFIILIIAGTLLLMLPFSTTRGISLIDAIFTSTSAVCVTGLTVIDTGKDFTIFGQAVILFLIQLGGLGIMTFSIGIFSMFSGGLSIKWRFTFDEIYNDVTIIPPLQILKRILLYTFAIESFTALVLYSQFSMEFGVIDSLWLSVFHSVSAFCNAGFSTFSDSLVRYNSNYILMTAISMNIVLGGLGFLVLTELAGIRPRKKKTLFRQFSLHSKIVLISSAILILAGADLFMFFEWSHIIKDMPLGEKISASVFQSITCRTAGFNSIDISSLRQSTLSVMMLLMFIGGSPGSIAGGIKTTTFVVISGLIISRARGQKQIVFWNRAIPDEAVNKSMMLVVLSFILVYSFTILLLSNGSSGPDKSYLDVMFEVVSAFGTVGLSTGITSGLPELSKFFLSIVMFAGRVGIFAILTKITADIGDSNIEIADENIMIG